MRYNPAQVWDLTLSVSESLLDGDTRAWQWFDGWFIPTARGPFIGTAAKYYSTMDKAVRTLLTIAATH